MHHPFLIQAPMAGASTVDMCIQVCRAGGIGSIAAALLDVQQLRQALEAVQAGLARHTKNGKQPPLYCVNFFAHRMPKLEHAAVQEKLGKFAGILDPHAKKIQVPHSQWPPNSTMTPAKTVLRKPFDADMMDCIEEFKPPIVSFHFGLPEDDTFLERIRRWNGKVWSSATSVEEAVFLEKRGVDAIIAQGLEAGGHRGHFLNTTNTRYMELASGTSPCKEEYLSSLLPRILQAVRVPVIAAGGITTPGQVQTVLKLGAKYAQCGTVYLLCHESSISPTFRLALKGLLRPRIDPNSTRVTNIFTGRPARGLTNQIQRDIGSMHSDAPPFPYAAIVMNPLREASEKTEAYRGDFSAMWAGENTSHCEEISAYDMTIKLCQ